MAPSKKFKTYSKGRNTSVSSAQAFDILFADNLTRRKLHRAAGKKNNKNMFEVKELQTRIKTLLQNEPSFYVNVNDTFDNVFKQQGNRNNLKSINISNAASSSFMRSQSSHFVSVTSPMVKKLRSFSKLGTNESSIGLRSWFEKPTPPGVGITNSLEIEVAGQSWKRNNPQRAMAASMMLRSGNSKSVSLIAPLREGMTNSLETSENRSRSPIMLRSGSRSQNASQNIPEPSKKIKAIDTSLINPIFTKSMRERILIHSSTPVVAQKTKCLVRQPISPIKNNQDPVSKCIFESLDEIKSWNTSLATSTEPSCSKSVVNTFEKSQPQRLPRLTVNLEAFEGFLTSSMNQIMENQTDMTAYDSEELHTSRGKKRTSNISLTEFESFYSTSYQRNISTNNSSFVYKTQQTNNFITRRRRGKRPLSPENENNQTSSKLEQSPNDKQLVIKLQRLSMPANRSKSILRSSHSLQAQETSTTNRTNNSSLMNRTNTELSLYVEESKSVSQTAGSFNRSSSQVFIKAKESSVLRLKTRSLGFEDVSEKENDFSSASSSRIPKRKSLLNSSLPEKRYLKSSIVENSDRPSTSTTAVDSNISEDLFTSGDFTNTAQYQLSVLLTKTEISSTSLKDSTKCSTNDSSISSFTYDDPRERSHKTDYYKDLHELESSQQSWVLKADASYVPENNIIVIDDSCNDETRDTIDKSAFKMPLAPINRKTGKSWRRSIYCEPKNRLSIKIVPLEQAGARQLRRQTLLQSYIGPRVSTIPSLTAKDIVFKYCNQTEPELFETLYPKSLLQGSKKIGEGVYGEVFLCPKEDGEMTVMKIIPIEGGQIINGEKQKMFQEILSEVVIVSQLSNLRNTTFNKTSAFCEVQKISCVMGKYPETLLQLWHAYDKAKGSENDPPDLFDKDQLYIVLELGNAGQDLEAYVFQNAAQSLAMFKQIAFALAVAEEQLQFEHRDLHWGNVLLRPNRDKKTAFKFKGKRKSFASEGVEATIIDFTLSRVVHDGVVIYNDLALDPELFTASGDYQFDVYRLMKEKNNNDWKSYTPYSNVLWLHYVLKKSMTALRYKNPGTKTHKKYINLLKKYEGVILNFDSVSAFVTANL